MTGYSRYLRNCSAVDEQIDWIRSRGGDLAGYIAFYAQTKTPPEAERIYQADRVELTRLMEIAADSSAYEEGARV